MSAARRIQLVDVPGESRTTTTLLASLAARLGTLHFLSGSTAIGTLVAGIAAHGAQISASAEGARLRRSLEQNRIATNGERLWKELRIADWMTTVPAAPVIDQMRNDLALLLATDVDESLQLMPLPSPMTGGRPGSGEMRDETTLTFLDYVIGLWALSRELTSAIEAIAAPTASTESIFTPDSDDDATGPSWMR
ncbi:MAG TPA: hypothetical protein VF215_10325 [Thermoanaerobaculia bacterium]